MYKVKIEKAIDYSPMPGRGNSKFYGYAYVNSKRVGTVWQFNDGHYVMNEDVGHHHTREKRPKQFSAPRLSALKLQMQQFDWNEWTKAYSER